jgi:hypothetical protein
MVNRLAYEILLCPCFSWWCNITFDVSLSHRQIYDYVITPDANSSPSISPCYSYMFALSTVFTEYSIHQVQHILSTAHKEYSIHWPLNIPSTASSQDCLSHTPSQSGITSLGGSCCTQISTFPHSRVNHIIDYELQSSQPPNLPPPDQHHLNGLLPAASPILNYPGLHTHLPTCSFTASNLTWTWHLSVSSTSINCGLEVHLQTCSTTASAFTQSWPPSVCLMSLDYSLLICRIQASYCAQLWVVDESVHLLNHGLSIHRLVCTVTGYWTGGDLKVSDGKFWESAELTLEA